MALKQVEGRSAARRSRPSLNVARQTDTMQIAPEASEIQIAPYADASISARPSRPSSLP